MANEKLGCAIFAITAVMLALSSLNIFNTQEKFTEVMPPQSGSTVQNQAPNFIQKYTTAPTLTSATALENYQDNLIMNVGTSVEDVNKSGAQYYLNLQNYLNPSIDNLELAQNISSRPIVGGVPLPGAAEYYSNNLGDGFVSNLGQLTGQYFPSVNYQNNRAMQLSNCAKDLPMFAASSLLPKPSVNADNNALSQSAARALAAFTALSPSEQIGAITSNGTPYSKTSDYRALDQISTNNMQTPMFGASPALYIPPTFGQVNSLTDQSAPSGFVTAAPPSYRNM
jgi:hypothetical protein